MGIPKYSQIAVELLRRIKSGVYKDKLPPMRELASEFDTAVQTMFNAVQLLVKKELLVPCGSGGMIIDRSKLPCGLIAIVMNNGMLHNVAAFEQLSQAISDDGSLPVYLGVPRKQSLYTAKKLFQADISGGMFFCSTINWDDIIAEPLPDKGVLPEAVINWNSSGVRCIKQYQGTDVLQLLSTNAVKEEYIPEVM